MTSGAVIFAFNSETTDYISMARWNAKRIKRFLRLPTTIITDTEIDGEDFDQVLLLSKTNRDHNRWFADIGRVSSWYNHDRCMAYVLSPYDRTLLIDADYVINSNVLDCVINCSADFLCHDQAFDVSRGRILEELACFGRIQMPMLWATVMIFSKTQFSGYIFDCMKMVRDNWQHYRDIYGIAQSMFRNDYALTIAAGIISGHTGKINSIPWALPTVMPDVEVKVSKSSERFDYHYQDSQGRWKRATMIGQDFHAMGKRQLGEMIEQTA
jgi:hypothetical protein